MTEPTQPSPRLRPAKRRVRVAKWALVLTAAASFGTATTVLARNGHSGTAATPVDATVATAVDEGNQAEQESDDFFGSGSVAPQSDFGSSPSSPSVRTRTS